MIALGIISVLAVVFLVALVLTARGHATPVSSVEQLTALGQPVDLDAFRTLIATDEEDYLRNNLHPRQFRQVQRLRMRAALDYVRRAAHNSAILIRLGEVSRRSKNPQVAQAGAELADVALQMRLMCLLAMAKITIRIAFPQVPVSVASLVDRYAATRDRVVAFGRIEFPTSAGRLESSL